MANMALLGLVFLVIGAVIGMTIYLQQAPTVHSLTDTATGKPLENVTGTAKTIYQNGDVFWALGFLALIAGVVYGVGTGKIKV